MTEGYYYNERIAHFSPGCWKLESAVCVTQ